MKYSRPTIWMVLIFLFVTPFTAYMQGECAAFVKEALAATDDVCTDTGRNEACYGHISLSAEPQSSNIPFKFDEVGDKVNVARLSRLSLTPMDVEADVWGVALLKVQADIPNSLPNANVSVLVFGDVQLENAIPDPVYAIVRVKGPSNANIRRQPSNRAFVIDSLAPTTEVTAKGRSKDGAWLYIALPDNEGNGWVRRSLMTSAEDLTTLKELDPSLTSYGPMQAFYLKNGKSQTSCESVPNDGILIQTPEGVAQVQLWINEVKIKLGSTAFIQAQPDTKMMSITTLEGAAHVEAMGVEQVAVEGTTVTVRVDENLVPVAPPSLPHGYNIDEVQSLPVQSLERQITAAPPVFLTPTFTPTVTFTPTASIVPSVVATNTPTSTNTDLPTNTLVPTNTAIPPTNTPVPTNTLIPPTDTHVPTNTLIPPTNTPLPPPPTDTNVPPLPTGTNVPPPTSVPPTVPTDSSVSPPAPTSTEVLLP